MYLQISHSMWHFLPSEYDMTYEAQFIAVGEKEPQTEGANL